MSSPAAPAAVEARMLRQFGQAPQRASVSFVGVEPIEVLRFAPSPDERSYVTLGMSRYPMAAAREQHRTPDGPRAELVLDLLDPRDECVAIWRRLALLAAAPEVEGVVYAPGMTVDLGQILVPGSLCTGGVIGDPRWPEVITAAGPVTLLSFLPATSTELAWSRVRGAAALLERWSAAGIDVRDLGRASAPLH